MSLSGGNLTASTGANLTVGVYTIGVRAKDNAGNWSPVTSTMLVVYDPTSALGISGRSRSLVPSLANGDIMPGLISSTQTDASDYGMTVSYKNGVIDSRSGLKFNYSTGTNCHNSNASNCHSFSLNATSFAWLIIDSTNNSRGRFQGTATLTVDGVTTTNPFTVTGIDGNLLTPVVNDSLVLKVFAPGADPSTATAIYQASGSMASANSVKIQ